VLKPFARPDGPREEKSAHGSDCLRAQALAAAAAAQQPMLLCHACELGAKSHALLRAALL